MGLALALLLLVLWREVAALRITNVTIPSYTFRGEDAHLECRYELESDKLYSISWYKDTETFYKYVPTEKNPQRIYNVEGVKVDAWRSTIHQVILQNVDLRTRGRYKCEVSGEKPNFRSVYGEADMEVIVLAREGPKITGEEEVYATGDVLALNCTSGVSHPATRLKWFINGIEVKPDAEMIYERHGLYETKSSLRLELGPNHLGGERINVKCVASIHSSFDENAPVVETRKNEIYVRGQGSLSTTPCLYLVAVAVLQRLLISA